MSEVVESRFLAVSEAVSHACRKSGRSRDDVQLVAVSKTVPSVAIKTLLPLGQDHFGESRVQEAEPKMDELPKLITWHFIGNIQKNKLRKIVALLPVIHSVSTLEIARRLSVVATGMALTPRVFLQVNLAGELSKGGFSIEEVKSSLGEMLSLDGMELSGLMCIPPFTEDKEGSRPYFQQLRALRDELEAEYGCDLPGLSMGMSHDFEVAIEEGATHIRVGSSIFGDRQYPGPAFTDS